MHFHRLLFCFTLLFVHVADAGIRISSTRVIYPAGKRDVSLSLVNDASEPRLLQAWIDNGDPDVAANTIKLPFIVTPPIFRLNPGKGQSLRILFTGGDIARDRESVYWLNVLEVQPTPADKKAGVSYVQFPVRSRLKIFYRPTGLPGSPQQAIGALRWRRTAGALVCDNPSAFNVSFHDVRLKGASGEKQSGMCPAKGRHSFPASGTASTVAFITINDQGGNEPGEADIHRD